ncbi:hypothetical protein [Herbidospora yilanensis]|nr:hypothetical protein [Herbidospora yilanensis]
MNTEVMTVAADRLAALATRSFPCCGSRTASTSRPASAARAAASSG